ncbi:MAG: hypothetical protein HY690_15360 [Chloroflexi bacterium]|nr:hypothetical protein [Chloroflexota bacterium]
MKGGKRLRREEQALLALLAEPTVEAAAKAAGVSPVTLWRWLQHPDFQERYREARRRVLEHAIAVLQQVAGEAAATLRRNLVCGTPSVEVRAALGILDQAVKGTELLDLEQRVLALETQRKEVRQ